MTDYTELKRLAENHQFLGHAYTVATPDAVLALIAENEAYASRLHEVATACATAEQERDQLKAENELARMRIREMDLLFGRYILAMRSALIEEEHGKGPAAAMEWIYNSLAGPGELPPEGETDSQAYFDREIVAVDDGMQQVMAFHEARRPAMGKAVQP